MDKKVYYYCQKFPSYGIEFFEACDIEYECKESEKEYKRISAINSYYCLNTEKYNDEEYYYTYNVYQPYDDEKLFEYNSQFGTYIFSFDEEAIRKSWLDDVKRYLSIHGHNVDKCREVLRENNLK